MNTSSEIPTQLVTNVAAGLLSQAWQQKMHTRSASVSTKAAELRFGFHQSFEEIENFDGRNPICSFTNLELLIMHKVFFVVVVSLALVACEGNRKLVTSYCDKEISYDLWKQEGNYQIDLRVGTVDDSYCRNSLLSVARRRINLHEEVSSPEEARKLIEKYRLTAEKIETVQSTRKVAKPSAAKPAVVAKPQSKCEVSTNLSGDFAKEIMQGATAVP